MPSEYRDHIPSASMFTVQIGGNLTTSEWVPPSNGTVRSLGPRDSVTDLGPSADAMTQFLQWVDRPAFDAYLSAARQFSSAARIDALASDNPRGQLLAVWGAWENISMAFMSLNVPITSWDRFRRVWAHHFGVSSAHDPPPDSGAVRVAAARMFAEANRGLDDSFTAPTEAVRWARPWGAGVADWPLRSIQIGGTPPPWLWSRYKPDENTIWGGASTRYERAGICSVAEKSIGATGPCYNPTYQHQTFNPSLGNYAGQQSVISFDRFCAEAACGFVDPMDYSVGSGFSHTSDIGGSPVGTFNRLPQFDNFAFTVDDQQFTAANRPRMLYAAPATAEHIGRKILAGSGSVATSVGVGPSSAMPRQLAAVAEGQSWRRDWWIARANWWDRSGAYTVMNYFPSLFVYWSILFAPIPGLRVGSDPRDMFSRDVEPGDISIVDYMTAVGPDQLIREIRRFVTISNIVSSRNAGVTTDADLYTSQAQDILNEVQLEVRNATNDEAMAQAIGNLAAGTARNFGPWGAAIGAVIGGATSVGILIKKMMDATPGEMSQEKVFNWPKDTFGNMMTRVLAPTPGREYDLPFLPFFVMPDQVTLASRLNQTAQDLAESTTPNGWDVPPARVFGQMPFPLASTDRGSRMPSFDIEGAINEYILNPAQWWVQYAPGLLRILSMPGAATGAIRLVPQGWTPDLSRLSAVMDGINDMPGLTILAAAPGPHTVTVSWEGQTYATLPVTVMSGATALVNLPPPPSGVGASTLAWGALGLGAAFAVWKLAR